MRIIYRFINKIWGKDTATPEKNKKETTKKYAREVIDQYEKTLRRLSRE